MYVVKSNYFIKLPNGRWGCCFGPFHTQEEAEDFKELAKGLPSQRPNPFIAVFSIFNPNAA